MKENIDINLALKNLKKNGIHIIQNFWTKEKCNIAIAELNNIHKKNWVVGQGGDLRCRPADKFSKLCIDFLENQCIKNIASAYSVCNVNESVQANIVTSIPNIEIDSGGGWHVDSIKSEPQFKSIIYLTDTTEQNGPFLFIPNTKKIIKEVPMYSNNRIEEKYIYDNFKKSIIKVLGSAGTCILVDTTNIHRGSIIQAGQRIALTTYWYPKKNKK